MINRQLPRLWAMNEFIKTPRGRNMYINNKEAFNKAMNKVIGPSPNKVGIAAGLGTAALGIGGIALEKRIRERQRRKQMLLR